MNRLEKNSTNLLKSRLNLVESFCKNSSNIAIVDLYKQLLINIANQYDDEEFNDYMFGQFLTGLLQTRLQIVQSRIIIDSLESSDIIAICAIHNAERLVELYVDYYNIGIRHFVFIDNASSDLSEEILRRLNKKTVYIDIWNTSDRFDGFKAMGWKQRLFAHYGLNRWYLNLDVDELLEYIGDEDIDIQSLIRHAEDIKQKTIGAVLVDMYPMAPVQNIKIDALNDIRNIYKYFDSNTYVIQSNEKYKKRISGGPRMRLFNRHPSLQKYPLAFVDTNMLAINPHFWYPYDVNLYSELLCGLLHYKFLPGDIEQYKKYIVDGVHWDGSSQYKSYVDFLMSKKDLTFYNAKHSVEYKKSSDLRRLIDTNNNR